MNTLINGEFGGEVQINKIIQGDNVELCNQLPNSCINLTVTSPPY